MNIKFIKISDKKNETPSLDKCVTAVDPEMARSFNEDGPCDDSR